MIYWVLSKTPCNFYLVTKFLKQGPAVKQEYLGIVSRAPEGWRGVRAAVMGVQTVGIFSYHVALDKWAANFAMKAFYKNADIAVSAQWTCRAGGSSNC